MRECEHCAKEHVAKLRCSKCQLFFFCDDKCFRADWKVKHKDVCRIVQLLAKSGDQAAAVRAPQDDAQALMELAVELLSCIDDATPSRARVQRFGLSLDCDLIKKAPQHCLRWLRAVCPSQIYLDRALGKQFGIPEGARMACALAMWRTEWRPTLQAARTPVVPPAAAASAKQAHLPLPSESESDGAQLFKQLVLIEQFDLLKFLGTDPKTCMWIGLSILFHQNAAALALYRMFFLELSIELQMVARSLQRLSWPQQAAWSSAFLSHHMNLLPPKPKSDEKKKKNKTADKDSDATGISALYDESELMDSSLNNAGGEEFSSHPDLARAVYFSGYPNYPPELTRLTRRKLEDVLANLSFLALLASTLSLDAALPATLCFSALASRGCLPLHAHQIGSTLTPSSTQSPSAGISTDSLRINMNALVFPQLMFEVWVNLPLVFFEMSVATTRRSRALVGFYHAMRTCLRGECCTPEAIKFHSPKYPVNAAPPCYICYWQLHGGTGNRANDRPTAAGAAGANLIAADSKDAAATLPATAAEPVPGIEWWRCLDHIACQALGLVRLADVRDIDQAVLREDTLWLTILLPLQCLTFLGARACNCPLGKDSNAEFVHQKSCAASFDADQDAACCEGQLSQLLALGAIQMLQRLVFVDTSVYMPQLILNSAPSEGGPVWTGPPASWCCSLEQSVRLVYVIGCLIAARRLFPDHPHLAPQLWHLAMRFSNRGKRRTGRLNASPTSEMLNAMIAANSPLVEREPASSVAAMDALTVHCLIELSAHSLSHHPALQSINFRLSINHFDTYQFSDIERLDNKYALRIMMLPRVRTDSRAGQITMAALKPRVRSAHNKQTPPNRTLTFSPTHEENYNGFNGSHTAFFSLDELATEAWWAPSPFFDTPLSLAAGLRSMRKAIQYARRACTKIQEQQHQSARQGTASRITPSSLDDQLHRVLLPLLVDMLHARTCPNNSSGPVDFYAPLTPAECATVAGAAAAAAGQAAVQAASAVAVSVLNNDGDMAAATPAMAAAAAATVDHAPVGLPIPAPAGSLAAATAFAHDPDLSHFITACPCSAVAGPLHDHLPAASMRCNIIECTRAIERVIGTLGSGVDEFSEESADALDQRGALVHSLHVKNTSSVVQSHNSVLCQRCHENYATFECRTCAFVARTKQTLPERQCRERLQNYGLNMHPHPSPLPVPSLNSMPEVQGQADAMFRGDGDSLMCDHCFQQTHQLDDCHVRIPFHPFALCTAPVPSVIESNQFNTTTVDSTGLPYLRLVSEPCVGSYWVTLDDQPAPAIDTAAVVRDASATSCAALLGSTRNECGLDILSTRRLDLETDSNFDWDTSGVPKTLQQTVPSLVNELMLRQILEFLPRALRSVTQAADSGTSVAISLGCSTNAIYALTVLSMWTVCPARFSIDESSLEPLLAAAAMLAAEHDPHGSASSVAAHVSSRLASPAFPDAFALLASRCGMLLSLCELWPYGPQYVRDAVKQRTFHPAHQPAFLCELQRYLLAPTLLNALRLQVPPQSHSIDSSWMQPTASEPVVISHNAPTDADMLLAIRASGVESVTARQLPVDASPLVRFFHAGMTKLVEDIMQGLDLLHRAFTGGVSPSDFFDMPPSTSSALVQQPCAPLKWYGNFQRDHALDAHTQLRVSLAELRLLRLAQRLQFFLCTYDVAANNVTRVRKEILELQVTIRRSLRLQLKAQNGGTLEADNLLESRVFDDDVVDSDSEDVPPLIESKPSGKSKADKMTIEVVDEHAETGRKGKTDKAKTQAEPASDSNKTDIDARVREIQAQLLEEEERAASKKAKKAAKKQQSSQQNQPTQTQPASTPAPSTVSPVEKVPEKVPDAKPVVEVKPPEVKPAKSAAALTTTPVPVTSISSSSPSSAANSESEDSDTDSPVKGKKVAVSSAALKMTLSSRTTSTSAKPTATAKVAVKPVVVSSIPTTTVTVSSAPASTASAPASSVAANSAVAKIKATPVAAAPAVKAVNAPSTNQSVNTTTPVATSNATPVAVASSPTKPTSSLPVGMAPAKSTKASASATQASSTPAVSQPAVVSQPVAAPVAPSTNQNAPKPQPAVAVASASKEKESRDAWSAEPAEPVKVAESVKETTKVAEPVRVPEPAKPAEQNKEVKSTESLSMSAAWAAAGFSNFLPTGVNSFDANAAAPSVDAEPSSSFDWNAVLGASTFDGLLPSQGESKIRRPRGGRRERERRERKNMFERSEVAAEMEADDELLAAATTILSDDSESDADSEVADHASSKDNLGFLTGDLANLLASASLPATDLMPVQAPTPDVSMLMNTIEVLRGQLAIRDAELARQPTPSANSSNANTLSTSLWGAPVAPTVSASQLAVLKAELRAEFESQLQHERARHAMELEAQASAHAQVQQQLHSQIAQLMEMQMGYGARQWSQPLPQGGQWMPAQSQQPSLAQPLNTGFARLNQAPRLAQPSHLQPMAMSQSMQPMQPAQLGIGSFPPLPQRSVSAGTSASLPSASGSVFRGLGFDSF